MGMSFSNIQIYNPTHKKKYEVNDDYYIEYLASDWDTILDDTLDFEIDILDEAVILSERIHEPVIFVEYFDDDFLIIKVFNNESLQAYHYVGLDKKETKNRDVLIEALHVGKDKEASLIKVLECVNIASDALYYLENLCRIPLCSTMLDNNTDSYEFEDYNKIVDEIKTLSQIKNNMPEDHEAIALGIKWKKEGFCDE